MAVAVPTLAARVEFLSASEGGRQLPAMDSPEYRPHVVVGDPAQRKALVATDGHTLTEEYLGVCFTGDGRQLLPGQSYDVKLKLIYHPQVNYAALTRSAKFTIREGGRIVGFGQVL